MVSAKNDGGNPYFKIAPTKKTLRLTEKDLHVFRLGCVVLTPHGLEVQRRLAETGYVAGGKLWVDGLSGGDAVLAGPGGDEDGDGIVVEMRGDGVPDCLVEAVVVAEVEVIAAEAAVVLAGDWSENGHVSCTTRFWSHEQG